MADRAVDALTNQRRQRRANGQRQAAPVGEIGQDQADDDVDAPAVQPPVEQGHAQGDLRRFRGIGSDAGHVHEGVALHVHDRLGDAPEQQPGADRGAEQHGEPGEIAELRPLIVAPQAQVTETAQADPEGEEQHDADHGNVIPAQGTLDPLFDAGVEAIGQLAVGHREQHEDQHHRQG
ncbi:hypothetical protein D9M68_817300 [compost metagenome]